MTNLVDKIFEFGKWTSPYRDVFGFVAGIQIARQMRKAMSPLCTGQLVKIKIPGWKWPLWLRAGSSDAAVFCQAFLDREGFVAVPEAPRFIVDAGANIGLISLCLANRFPASQIIALEVDDDNFQLLERNCQNYPTITALRIGLWSHSASLAIDNPEANSWSFQVNEVPNDTPAAIPAVSISDILCKYNKDYIDLLKIDIEGSEYEVFSKGLDGWIDQVKCIVIEIHEGIKPGVTELIESSLRNKGFSSCRFSEWWIFTKSEIA